MTDGGEHLARLGRMNPAADSDLAPRAHDTRGAADLARITAQPTQGVGHRSPRGGRGATAAVGAAVATGAAGLAVVLFTDLPGGGDGRPAALPPGGWGIEATIEVRPEPGGPGLEAATARAADIMRARADARGFDDVDAAVTGPGLVRLTVPWAILPRDVDPLAAPADVAVFDLTRDLLADSRDPARALRAVRGRPGTPRGGWYLFSPDGRTLLAGARRRPGRVGAAGDGGTLGARPGGHPRRGRDPGDPRPSGAPPRRVPALYLVLARPAIPPDAVTGARLSPPTARLSMTGDARPVRGVAVAGGLVVGRAVRSGDTVTVRPVGAFPGAIRFTAPLLAGGGLSARMVVASRRPVGTPPPRRGDRPRNPPEPARRLADPPAGWTAYPPAPPVPGSLLRVLDGRLGGARWSVWEVLTAGGGNAFIETSGDGTAGGSVDCVLAPNARIVRSCLFRPDAAIGRVAPGVARVELRYPDGSRIPGLVENGWFVAAGPRAREVPVVALDAGGRVVGRTAGG